MNNSRFNINRYAFWFGIFGAPFALINIILWETRDLNEASVVIALVSVLALIAAALEARMKT